jgi:hypothetical protein
MDEMVNGRDKKVRTLFYHTGAMVILFTLLSCAVTPRVSTWQSPKRFMQKDVFNAALQAGRDQGLQLAGSDQEAGNLSFHRKFESGEMVLSVTVRDINGIVQVRTTALGREGAAKPGLEEETINNFHGSLFKNLGISSTSEQNVIIDKLR